MQNLFKKMKWKRIVGREKQYSTLSNLTFCLFVYLCNGEILYTHNTYCFESYLAWVNGENEE